METADENKILGFLGLARKAGCLSMGQDATLAALASGNVFLLVLSTDIGGSTEKKIRRAAENVNCEILQFGSSESLGHFVGGKARAVLGVLDESFAKGIRQSYLKIPKNKA